jgi:hypothetical protein
MEIAGRTINTIRVISILGFLAALLWIYASLPASARVYLFDESTAGVGFTRNQFFYTFLGVFAFINIVLFAVIRTLRHTVAADYVKELRKQRLALWLGLCHIGLNICIIGFVLFYGLQSFLPDFSPQEFFFLVITGPAILLLSLFALPPMLFKLGEPTKG